MIYEDPRKKGVFSARRHRPGSTASRRGRDVCPGQAWGVRLIGRIWIGDAARCPGSQRRCLGAAELGLRSSPQHSQRGQICFRPAQERRISHPAPQQIGRSSRTGRRSVLVARAREGVVAPAAATDVVEGGRDGALIFQLYKARRSVAVSGSVCGATAGALTAPTPSHGYRFGA